MSTRKIAAITGGAAAGLLAMLLMVFLVYRMRGYLACGGEIVAAIAAGLLVYWLLDIRAARMDMAERRRRQIIKRNR